MGMNGHIQKEIKRNAFFISRYIDFLEPHTIDSSKIAEI